MVLRPAIASQARSAKNIYSYQNSQALSYPAGSVQVTGPIGTTAQSDTYPTYWDFQGYGGARCVLTVADMYAITSERRVFGMKVEVTADTDINNNGTYVLNDLENGGVDDDVTNNDNWQFYNGNYGGRLVTIADVSFTFNRDGICEIFWLKSDTDFTLLFGTTDGGMEIGPLELIASKPESFRLDYPVENGTIIYLSGITNAGATLTLKKWTKY